MTIVFIEESTLFCPKSHEGDERMANQFRVSCSSSHRWTSYQLKFIYLYVYFRDIGSYSSLFACAFTLWEENPVESVVPWSAHLLQKGGSCTTRTHWPAQDSQSSWRNVHPLVENLLSGFYSLSTSILGACAWIYSPLLRRRPAQWSSIAMKPKLRIHRNQIQKEFRRGNPKVANNFTARKRRNGDKIKGFKPG